MAILDIRGEWQMTNIDKELLLIQYPGIDSEKVHVRSKLTTIDDVKRVKQDISKIIHMNNETKEWAFFWLGYFYAHLRLA